MKHCRRFFAIMAIVLCLGLALPVATAAGKNPEWMELYWNVFCQYVEDKKHNDDTDFGRYAHIDIFDLNGDGSPEMILNARLFTIRGGKVLIFQGYHTFNLYRNKNSSEEKFILCEMQGDEGDYMDVYTEYHIDWNKLVITKGEELARFNERDIVFETTEYGDGGKTSNKKHMDPQTEFKDAWLLIHDMPQRQTLVEGHNRMELQRSFYEALQVQGYAVPVIPSEEITLTPLPEDFFANESYWDWYNGSEAPYSQPQLWLIGLAIGGAVVLLAGAVVLLFWKKTNLVRSGGKVK